MAHFLLQTKHVPVDASPKKHWVCDHACPSLHRGPESRSRQLLVSSRSQANLHYPRNSAKTSRVLSLVQWAWWVLDQQKTSQNKRYDSNTKAQLNCLFCFHKLIESKSINDVWIFRLGRLSLLWWRMLMTWFGSFRTTTMDTWRTHFFLPGIIVASLLDVILSQKKTLFLWHFARRMGIIKWGCS